MKTKINISCIKFALENAKKRTPNIIIFYTLRLVLLQVYTIIYAYLLKKIIDLLVACLKEDSNDYKLLLVYMCIYIAVGLAMKLLNDIINYKISIWNQILLDYDQSILAEKSLEIPYCEIEKSEAADEISAAKDGIDWYSNGTGGVISDFFALMTNGCNLVTLTIATILKLPILIICQLLFAFAVIRLQRSNSEVEVDFFSKLSKLTRRWGYYYYEITKPKYSKDVRIFNLSDKIINRTAQYEDEMVSVWNEKAATVQKGLDKIEVISILRDVITYFAIIVAGLLQFLTIGDITYCITISDNFYNSLVNFGRSREELLKKTVYYSNYLDFIEKKRDSENTEAAKDEKNSIDNEFIIVFENVSFKYNENEPYILKDFSLKIRKGEHLCLIGANGSGKSTIIKLICGLYKPESGNIYINGKNVSVNSERKMISPIFQDFTIFEESLEFNIAMNTSEDSMINKNKLNEVLEIVGLKEKIKSMPNGTKTILSRRFGEDETLLSGGELQRVSIARAMYCDAEILIMDEPTANVDDERESDLIGNVINYCNSKTIINVTHKLFNCRHSSRIVCLSKGKIVQDGTFEELMKNENGMLYQIYARQMNMFVI
jgi:ABC-type multidrug transport system fused ATPase/permease subunit